MAFEQSNEICSYFWQFFSSCEWSNKQTFFLEIILALVITITIGIVFFRLESKRHKKRQQYALLQLFIPVEAALENLKHVEKISNSYSNDDKETQNKNFELAIQLINGIKKEIEEIEKLLKLLHFDIEPHIKEKINKNLGDVKGWVFNFPHWERIVPPSDFEIIENFSKLHDMIKNGASKF